MYGKPDLLLIWPYVIANADPVEHTVELNPVMLSGILGKSEGEISAMIQKLCEPDPMSRTPDHEGRRLEKLSQFRFLVVTHEKYTTINDEDRRANNAAAQRRSRAQRNGPPQDANIPTWEEVKDAASGSAVLESTAKNFYDYHQGNNLWLNRHNKLIDWRHKLVTWSVTDRGTPGGSRYGTPPLHLQLRAVQVEIEKHVANPESVYYKDTVTDLERAAYRVLKKRRDELNRQIALAGMTPAQTEQTSQTQQP